MFTSFNYTTKEELHVRGERENKRFFLNRKGKLEIVVIGNGFDDSGKTLSTFLQRFFLIGFHRSFILRLFLTSNTFRHHSQKKCNNNNEKERKWLRTTKRTHETKKEKENGTKKQTKSAKEPVSHNQKELMIILFVMKKGMIYNL